MRSLSIHLNCYKENYFFFTKYKNDWRKRKFWRQKNKKVTFTKTKK